MADKLPSLAVTVTVALPSPVGVILILELPVLCTLTTFSSLDITMYVSVSPSGSLK